MKKKILIAVHTNTFFIELMRLSKLLRISGKYQFTLFFVNPYPTWLSDLSKCIDYNFECIDSYGDKVGRTKNDLSISSNKKEVNIDSVTSKFDLSLKIIRQLKFRVINKIMNLFPIINEATYFLKRFKLINKILINQKPSMLILGGDMVCYDTSVFIKLGHRIGSPTIIVPSTMSNGLEQAEVFYNNPIYSMDRWLNKIIGFMFPKWVKNHRGKKLLRSPGERVLLMELLGLSPPLPWIFNSGFADAIAIESEQMRRYYLDCGLSNDQLCVTGSLADDMMALIKNNYTQNRKSLLVELGLDEEKPIILSALPPDFLYVVGGRPDCDFDNYRDLVKYWVQSLASITEYNIIICLHPSVCYEHFKYIEDWGVKIALKDTTDLIPLCDIYVASVSSTIRWAIACGKPVINYDVYRYQYTDYSNEEAVITIEDKETYLNQLQKLTFNRNYYTEIAALQEKAAYKWGRLDGSAGQLLLDLIDTLIILYSKESSTSEYATKLE